MNKCLDDGELSEDEIYEGSRAGTLAGGIIPVFCGTAFKNKGVQALLDAVIRFLPSPGDRPPVKGVDEREVEATRAAGDKETFSALAFKIMTEPFVWSLSFFPVYFGTITAGEQVFNPNKTKNEKKGGHIE